MSLLIAPKDLPLHVVKVSGDDKTRKHLEDLGITRGALITVIEKTGKSTIVMIKASRLALDKDISSSILVA